MFIGTSAMSAYQQSLPPALQCAKNLPGHHNNEKHASESQVDMADMQITHPFSGVLGLSRRCLGAGPHTAEESHGQRSPAPCHSDLSAEAAAQEARRHAFSGSYRIGRCRCCCPPRPSICRSSCNYCGNPQQCRISQDSRDVSRCWECQFRNSARPGGAVSTLYSEAVAALLPAGSAAS